MDIDGTAGARQEEKAHGSVGHLKPWCEGIFGGILCKLKHLDI